MLPMEDAARKESSDSDADAATGPECPSRQSLPKVLIVHTGGTLGMDSGKSYVPHPGSGKTGLAPGTGGSYKGGLRPGTMLRNMLQFVPELSAFANIDLKIAFNMDSSRVGPDEWRQLASLLDKYRGEYDAFIVVHGTDTMAYTASALSLMLAGFRKPIVLTGSQLPLAQPRSDARQNLVDAVCAAVDTPHHNRLQEVAICFGGKLLRGNRAQKVDSSCYQAFGSPSYSELAVLGVDIDWRPDKLLQVATMYTPRLDLNPRVLRVPIVPGSNPSTNYGDLAGRGVAGIVLEAFGVGNMPDGDAHRWLPWLREQRAEGLQVYLSSQCTNGTLQPELYRSGSVAIELGIQAAPLMTPECASVKMMLVLAYPNLKMGVPLAGEMTF